ncbi:MAG: endonuclease III domain-containing protein [Deltaproteobacteria bacterium]|nr:endonuclease III domain-containing protein [Deltaproteobacteria bacterium]
MAQVRERLAVIYQKLNEHFGDLKWWPGETPFEISVGAILTQNTSWKNVEKAIRRLKAAEMLTPERLFHAKEEVIAELIRPSGYYRIKAKRLKFFIKFLYDEYNGSMEKMFGADLWDLRKKLLGVHGIGEETADSIMLYGGGKDIFVVDTYTRRIMERAGLVEKDWTYGHIQKLFMENLPQERRLYNQYHAFLVNTGKYYCKRDPRCDECPLRHCNVDEIP